MVGSGRAALSLSWMIWRRSPTQHFPARRMSSAKPSRSPRISKSCCERLRRTNMTGQDLKRNCLSGLFFLAFFSLLSFQTLTSSYIHDYSVTFLVAFISYHFPFFLSVIFTLPPLILLPLCSAVLMLFWCHGVPVPSPL